MSESSFSVLPLPKEQLANLESLGYHRMTPIQADALPVALQGTDIIAQAKTGSGKTAVFGLTIVSKLDPTARHVQALVLCPTRELSLQVATEIRRLARFRQNIKVTTLYGGQPISLQKQSLKHGTHIVVGTPGRIKDHLQKNTLQLDQLNTLVLDEADRMLEMGFIGDMEAIIERTPAVRQTLLFSATYPDDIQSLSARFQRHPQRITVDERHQASAIRQHVYACGALDKTSAMVNVLLHYRPVSAVVFCNFKQTTLEVCEHLQEQGFSALMLNGDLEQREREEVLLQFKHQSCSILVATDVAARGLDIKELPLVINFELPHDQEVYVHRIGRTGRAGHSGVAISLLADGERGKLTYLNDHQQTSLRLEPVSELSITDARPWLPEYVTFCISGGRKDKIRPGEILGALTGTHGLTGSEVGKIDVLDLASYVAIRRDASTRAQQQLKTAKIKGRSFRVRPL